jgi:hypothetical protein
MSLESLDLSYTGIIDTDVIALVYGLGTIKTLKGLDLYYNGALSQSGRAAIERLMGYNVSRELILDDILSRALALRFWLTAFLTYTVLQISATKALFVMREGSNEGSETFHALCESLRGKTALRYLDVRCNGVRLDGVARKLGTPLAKITDPRDMLSLKKPKTINCNATSCCQVLVPRSIRFQMTKCVFNSQFSTNKKGDRWITSFY